MVDNNKIWIEYMPIDEIVRAGRNPKGHDAGKIYESMKRFGYITPMLIDERTGRLVAGEGRLNDLQMEKARGERAPERVVVGDDGRWYAPVVRGVEFRDDREAEAYLIADNRLSEIGGWDDERQLAEMLSDLAAQGMQMLTGVGYDGDDIDGLWRRLKGEEDREEDKDDDDDDKEEEEGIGENERTAERAEEIEELAKKWGVEDGDIWLVDDGIGVVVVCGDCREDICWREGLRAMEVEGKHSVGGVVTSPPYAEQRKREYGGIGEEEYGEWWRDVQIRIGEWLKEDGSFFLNMKAHSRDGERSMYVMDLVKRMKDEWGWKFIDEYCWLRNPPPGSWPNRLKNGFEPVYHFGLSTAIKFRPDNVKLDSKGEWKPSSNVNMGNYWNTADTAHEWDGSYPSNVLDVRENAPGIGHVAAYPVKVPEFFVKAFSDEGDVWVDPFCGSGSTLIACLENSRMGLGIEKEPKYVAITLQRFVEMYDLKPVKIGEL